MLWFYFQLHVKNGLLDLNWSAGDVIDEILQFKATTLCSFDYVINVVLA